MTGYSLGAKKGPEWKELIPKRGEHPPVEVLFPPAPPPMALRKAREAVGEVMREATRTDMGRADAIQLAGDAFTRAILRYSILDWRGLIDEDSGEAIAPTHDVHRVDPETDEALVEPGTITAFLGDPRLVEAADRAYVVPWTLLDAEKNVSAPSPNGTSEGATPGAGTARLRAKQRKTGGAGTKKPTRRHAHTKNTPAKRTRAKASGS